MADVYTPPGSIGVYPAVTGVIGATAAAQVAALKAVLENLFGPPGNAAAGAAHPDFNKIPPSVRNALFVEVDALFVAIAAAPTS